MQQLNAAFRGINTTTDVLSFPQFKAQDQKSRSAETTSELILGDIVISAEKAAYRAKGSGIDFYEEVYRLLIHGTLHLLGYDHEKSRYRASTMRKKEQEILDAVKKMG